MSFARESALTAGEQVILYSFARLCYVRTQDVRRRNAACSSFCRYSSRYRGCVRRQDSLRVTSSFLRSSALRERWLACKA